MLSLAADENFDGRVVRGLQRSIENLDLIRVQDTALEGATDEVVLEWAAEEGRIVLTHDVGTMTAAAWSRVRMGLPMPGLIELGSRYSIGQVIEDLSLIILTSSAEELEGQVLFLPL